MFNKVVSCYNKYMKYIKLSKGYICKVDDGTYTKLSSYNWFYNNGYANRRLGAGQISMHRELLGLYDKPGNKTKYVVDHINKDKLDNRIENLRLTTRSVNSFNMQRRKYDLPPAVTFHKNAKKWVVSYKKEVYKYFTDKKEAISFAKKTLDEHKH